MPKKVQIASPSDAIDWPLLRAFVAVVEYGSLSKAAQRLQTTQPTVGRHIRALEARLGETLFDRVPTGLRPTLRAAELFERALAVEQAVTGLSTSISRVSPDLEGVVRVTTSMTFAIEVLPRLLAPLHINHPALQVELMASDAVSNLARREADIAVRFVRPAQPDVVAVKAAELAIGIYAHQDYLARVGPPKTAADWLQHTLIGMEDPAVTLAEGAAIGLDLQRANVRFRSDTYLVQIAALRAGIGIGTCQVWLAGRYPELVRLDDGHQIPSLPVWVAAHDDLHRSRRIRTVFDQLVAALKQEFPSGVML